MSIWLKPGRQICWSFLKKLTSSYCNIAFKTRKRLGACQDMRTSKIIDDMWHISSIIIHRYAALICATVMRAFWFYNMWVLIITHDSVSKNTDHRTTVHPTYPRGPSGTCTPWCHRTPIGRKVYAALPLMIHGGSILVQPWLSVMETIDIPLFVNTWGVWHSYQWRGGPLWFEAPPACLFDLGSGEFRGLVNSLFLLVSHLSSFLGGLHCPVGGTSVSRECFLS